MSWDFGYESIINKQPDDRGLFLFCAARLNDGWNSSTDRCDAEQWGPIGPVRHDDQRAGSLFGSAVVTSVQQLMDYRILFDFSPAGYIIFIALRDVVTGEHDQAAEDYLCNAEDPPCCARTMPQLIRLMWEWAQMVNAPFLASETPAATSAAILQALDLPAELLADLLASTPDMQVAKYLQGDTDARRGPDLAAIPPTPPALSAHLKNLVEPAGQV